MFDNWLLMQLQKRIDVVHISTGEPEIEFHDCGVIYFSSFIFFSFFLSIFCFHVWRFLPQESHLEKEKILHYL